MTRYPLWQIDAFADHPFTGNPAAVMPLDAWLDDAVLQAIAAENNLAETAFTVPCDGDDADYELRWFTPTVEVALCGHATLASGHILLGERDRVRFRTRKSGVLTIDRAGDGYALTLPAKAPSPKPLLEIAAAMGGEPIETLWHEGGYSVLVYPNEAAVRALTPDFRALKPLGDFLYIATAQGQTADVVSRAFAPGAGIDEDPVTGSAHAAIAPVWAERLGRTRFTAYQASARGGHLGVELTGDRVILTGKCVTVIEGTMWLSD
ncbi:PhzF family phenazine biosynthesis protein [Sphingomonas vulcanisoli]|uniref:PhzF family phenazine biosynthesis protein n=1 Tax=Sphingomonas vulcanisoli TaxID=1658060 RepID=A0ABX0TLU4_9SPHN|nr:PhzF family phenazine biosynthesis protein [Sphingomonas vulcanisoli]NIJ06481.1 PhzF family phenazine biosynthesis protein [Sphingomonas vulcanisoli]